MSPPATVHVIDDEPCVRRSLQRLLRSCGYECEVHPGADAFLRAYCRDGPTCLVLDMQLGSEDGFEVLRSLRENGHKIPVVFITGQGDIPMGVQAMKGGAVDFFRKPVNDQALLGAIERALSSSPTSSNFKLDTLDQT